MRKQLIAYSLLAFSVAGCDLAPEFKLPEMLKPAAFKEDQTVETATVAPATDGRWKRFDEHAQIEEFAWWRMFNTPALDSLMDQAMKDNPTLEIAAQRVNTARAIADRRDAALLPSIGLGFGPQRSLQSPESMKPNMPAGTTLETKPYTLYTANGTISYELDLFGKNRGTARAAAKDADAEEANYRAARLSLQAEIAQTYYRVAALRMEDAILRKTITTREDALGLTKQRVEAGLSNTLELSTFETDLANVKADAAGVAQNLAVAEHSLAILIGVPPSELKVETADITLAPPSVPAGMPSTLLERRPDIKQAAQQIAAANERIGVARAGYFPDISLSAMGGFVSGDLNTLFDWSNRTWMIGPLAGTILTQPIFEGGAIAAARAETQADYAGAVANYKASVLNAFREVEDQLSATRNVATQSSEIAKALTAAKRAHTVAGERYKVGYSSHLDFLDAERSYLAAQRNQAQVLGNQYIATIQLVKALGGSWQAPSTPEKTGDAPLAKVEEKKPEANPAQ